MITFQQFIEAMIAPPRKFVSENMPPQQQIDQLITALQMKLNADPYMDVSNTINFYTKKLNFTYGPKAAEYWQKKATSMIKNMQAQHQAFSKKLY